MYGILAHLEPLKRCYKEADFSTFATTLNSVIDMIHSTKNMAIKEGTTSVNSNYKSSHVASTFMVIYIMLIRRVCIKTEKFVYGCYNLHLFFILH